MLKKTKHFPDFAGLLLIAIFFLFSCKGKENKQQPSGPPPPPRVEAFVVKTGSISEKIEFPGTLIAGESTEIRPEVSGRLTYLNIAEGKKVSQGTLLAKIYDGDLVAQLGKLKVQLKVAEETSSRYGELLKISGVSKQEYDLSVLEISNIKADMAIVSSNIRRTEIRAPFTGTLGLKMVSPGAYVTPSTIITELRQTDKLKVDFTLPERYISRIFNGMELAFSTEGSAQTYTARISATESGVTEENRSLKVRADVAKSNKALIPGAFVKVNPQWPPDTSALLVPSRAIIPQSRGKKAAVYKNGEVVFSDVETGIRDSATVQVISGIKAGDTLITTGLMGLKPGMKVILKNVSSNNQ